jgi:hypothetical protein
VGTYTTNIAWVVARVCHFRVLNQRAKSTSLNRASDAANIAIGAIRCSKGRQCKIQLIIMQNGDLMGCFHIQMVRNVLGEMVPLVTRVDEETARALAGPVDVLDARLKYLL